MIRYKSEAEFKKMRTAGAILKDVLVLVGEQVKPGVTTEQLDMFAESAIIKAGGEPGFKRVKGYDWATCMCVNRQVVHTPPSKYQLKNGDVLTFDIGVYVEGLHTDAARTVIVGQNKDSDVEMFLEAGKKAHIAALSAAKEGNRIGHISAAIEKNIKESGYFIIKELTGHGVGQDLHEDPYIPGYVRGAIDDTPQIKRGMALAIEVIYAKSTDKIASEKGNSWSLITADSSLAACFEDTVLIENNNTSILTGNYGKI